MPFGIFCGMILEACPFHCNLPLAFVCTKRRVNFCLSLIFSRRHASLSVATRSRFTQVMVPRYSRASIETIVTALMREKASLLKLDADQQQRLVAAVVKLTQSDDTNNSDESTLNLRTLACVVDVAAAIIGKVSGAEVTAAVALAAKFVVSDDSNDKEDGDDPLYASNDASLSAKLGSSKEIEQKLESVLSNGFKPTAAFIMVVELCVSDKTKPLLLANPAFIPYLVDALLLVRST